MGAGEKKQENSQVADLREFIEMLMKMTEVQKALTMGYMQGMQALQPSGKPA